MSFYFFGKNAVPVWYKERINYVPTRFYPRVEAVSDSRRIPIAGVGNLHPGDHRSRPHYLRPHAFRAVEMKKKKTKKQILEAECDKLWSQCIIARDRTCRGTNSLDRLSAHHIRSRTHRSTRWDLDNGLCLSWKVHFLQKANPERFQDLIINIIGDEKYQALKRKSLTPVNYTTADLEDIRDDLRKKLNDIKAGLDFDNIPF